MKKVLLVATVQSHIAQFHKPLIEWLHESGCQVDVAARNNLDVKPDLHLVVPGETFEIEFYRSPFSPKNFKAYIALKKVIRCGHYDVIHCNTPVAGILARIAAKKMRRAGETKVIYQAHGFHFYKGAPLKNWLLYYPVEKICSYFTDVLITINQEDYALAKRKMKAKQIEYVPGVGLDTQKFANATIDRSVKRRELGIPEGAMVLMSVGELNHNKNHEVVIRALAKLSDPNIHYMIAGNGYLLEHLQSVASELNIGENVHFLGYRRDIAELYKAADICVFPSIREGLGLAALEGMATGIPLIASDNRGARDYTEDQDNGILCQFDSVSQFADAISVLVDKSDLRREMGEKNKEKAKHFDSAHINARMKQIYEYVVEEGKVCNH